MGRKIFNFINIIKEGMLEVIFPKDNKCIVCKEEDVEGLCENCKKKIIKCSEDEISYAYYNSTMKKLILEFKFNKNFNSGELLSNFLIEKMRGVKEDYILTYVPISKKKKKTRGFNQCEYIARKIGKALDREVLETLIQVKDTKEQKTLKGMEREKNIEGAFKCINKKKIKNRNIVLIDDVITTGATLRECEKILKNSEIGRIKLLTIGKSDI